MKAHIQHVSRALWLMMSPSILENSCRCLGTFDKLNIYCIFMGVTFLRLIALHDWFRRTPVQAARYERHRQDEHVRMHAGKLALKCTCASSFLCISLTLLHTRARARTYTWRAAHLANRPHYTGGWTIDPLVEELKKSPFSSLPSRMCDMMSWSYLPALCSMTANLTCSPKTLHMTAKMSATDECLQDLPEILESQNFTILHRDNELLNDT